MVTLLTWTSPLDTSGPRPLGAALTPEAAQSAVSSLLSLCRVVNSFPVSKVLRNEFLPGPLPPWLSETAFREILDACYPTEPEINTTRIPEIAYE